jgi:hypothetical protein
MMRLWKPQPPDSVARSFVCYFAAFWGMLLFLFFFFWFKLGFELRDSRLLCRCSTA